MQIAHNQLLRKALKSKPMQRVSHVFELNTNRYNDKNKWLDFNEKSLLSKEK
jgi:hypothetical protein